jgi:hypothetical protein
VKQGCRIYLLRSDDAYAGLIWADSWLEGERLREVRVEPDGEGGPWGDLVGLAEYVAVFSDRAREELADILEGLGEWMPVVGAPMRLHAFDVTKVMDVLDEERSEIARSRSGEVVFIERYAWNSGAVDRSSPAVFKIPQSSSVFVTDVFRDRVARTGLTGFEFREV